MDVRTRNATLEMAVSRALVDKDLTSTVDNISIVADREGIVWLRGTARNWKTCQDIREIVGNTPGVTQVFCNMALRAHGHHN